MDTQVYDALKKALGPVTDIKVQVRGEEKTLLDAVVDWEDGVEKTRSANKDLTQQRESWETKEKEYRSTLATLTATKDALEKQVQDKDGTTKKKSQESEELQRLLNAQNEKIENLAKVHEESLKKVADAEERAKSANKKASEESLKKDLVTSLAEYKIEGAQADFAVTTILAKGFAKVVDNDEGLYERSICTVKEGKSLAADLKTLCKWVSETMPFLVSASGKSGTGMQHKSDSPEKSGNAQNYFSMLKK